MNPNGTIDAVLNLKGHDVWSVTPDQTVFEAIHVMAEKNLGAVLVMDKGLLVGMLSERDYTRKIAIKGKSSKETLVREIMTTNLITVTSRHTVQECMRLMNDHRVRHLPVKEEDRVIGVVSIGNLVNWIISAQNAAIGHLEDYISGKYPA
jgi:CBS domain-containing protein